VPKEVPVTRGVLIEITRMLLDDGWELQRREDIAEDARKYRLQHHRDQPRNVGFKRSDGKGHTVKLWLACDYDLAVEYKRTMPLFLDVPVSFPHGVGMFWALIVDANGKAIYFATPRNRTQNYKANCLWNAHITWKRVKYWPACPKCGVDMEIWEDANHGNYWRCDQNQNHADGRYARMDWNFCLSPEEREVKNREYRHRRKVRNARKKAALAAGKLPPQKAHDIRTPWKRKNEPPYSPAA
jgi:hypothetical protein